MSANIYHFPSPQIPTDTHFLQSKSRPEQQHGGGTHLFELQVKLCRKNAALFLEMYFPIGWPKYFSSKDVHCGELKSLKYNRDRSLLAVVSDHSVCVWNNRVSVVYILHRLIIVIYTSLARFILHRIITVCRACRGTKSANFIAIFTVILTIQTIISRLFFYIQIAHLCGKI